MSDRNGRLDPPDLRIETRGASTLIRTPEGARRNGHGIPANGREPHTGLDDAEASVVRLLEELGEDPDREGLRDTPRRYVRALRELTEGYRQDPAAILGRVFNEPHDEMVLVRDIEFSSLCEHHLLPFRGVATLAYIPNGKVVGLSKLSRLVQAFARRLQMQERLTNQIAEAMETHLEARGVAVLIKGEHTCMSMRGVRTPATMVTTKFLGAMREGEARREFLALAGTRE